MKVTRQEFDDIKMLVESRAWAEDLTGDLPDPISIMLGNLAGYYARLSGDLALIKDSIMREFIRLTNIVDDKGKGMAATKAEKEAEETINQKNEVSRRELEYLQDAIDKLSFACTARLKAFNKEGHY